MVKQKHHCIRAECVYERVFFIWLRLLSNESNNHNRRNMNATATKHTVALVIIAAVTATAISSVFITIVVVVVVVVIRTRIQYIAKAQFSYSILLAAQTHSMKAAESLNVCWGGNFIAVKLRCAWYYYGRKFTFGSIESSIRSTATARLLLFCAFSMHSHLHCAHTYDIFTYMETANKKCKEINSTIETQQSIFEWIATIFETVDKYRMNNMYNCMQQQQQRFTNGSNFVRSAISQSCQPNAAIVLSSDDFACLYSR